MIKGKKKKPQQKKPSVKKAPVKKQGLKVPAEWLYLFEGEIKLRQIYELLKDSPWNVEYWEEAEVLEVELPEAGSVDFEDLEAKVKDPSNKLLILSNPHNPVGRAWTKEELEKLGNLCADNNVLLISDEIHADLMMGGHKHQAVCAISEKIRQNTITHYAPSKTFNLAGLQTAYAIIPNDEMRAKYMKGLNANRIFNMNWFGSAALEAAYNHCDGYVTALCDYVTANIDYMADFLKEKLPMLKMEKAEATYMVWVDFRGTGMSTEEIETFIAQKAHIGTDMGTWFGPGGEGYLRFNLACPRKLLEKALNQLESALNA